MAPRITGSTLWLLRPAAKEPLLLPSLAENVSDAWLMLQFALRNVRSSYRPHDVAVRFKHIPVKIFRDTIPEGRYWFILDPHQISPRLVNPRPIASHRAPAT